MLPKFGNNSKSVPSPIAVIAIDINVGMQYQVVLMVSTGDPVHQRSTKIYRSQMRPMTFVDLMTFREFYCFLG